MRKRAALCLPIAAGALLLLTPSLAGRQTPDRPAPVLVNQRDPLPGLRTGGAPKTAEGFAALAAEGFLTYVDTRAAEEVTPEFVAAVEAAGLRHVHLPVGGEDGLDLANARALDAILDDETLGPVAVACRSGNRAAALLAVRAHWLEGASPEEALAIGIGAGLTGLEPSVRILLGLPPLEPENPIQSDPESAPEQP